MLITIAILLLLLLLSYYCYLITILFSFIAPVASRLATTICWLPFIILDRWNVGQQRVPYLDFALSKNSFEHLPPTPLDLFFKCFQHFCYLLSKPICTSFHAFNNHWDDLDMASWSSLLDLIGSLLILMIFFLFTFIDVSVTEVCYVYDLNHLRILILQHHIWPLCCCFLSHPILKVLAKFYHVIFYNRFLLLFQPVPVLTFFQQSLPHSSCGHQNVQSIVVSF